MLRLENLKPFLQGYFKAPYIKNRNVIFKLTELNKSFLIKTRQKLKATNTKSLLIII